MSGRPRNKFLPSIFEEKNDYKIQDFRKPLKISEDDEGDLDGAVRSGMYEAGEGVDEKIPREQQGPRSRMGAARWKTLIRSYSDNRVDAVSQSGWRLKRQGSAFVGGNRLNSGVPSSNRSFGQRKITSPGVNRARAVDMPEVIDLTNPEEVKSIAKRLFEKELEMDLSDPRFDKPEDFIASLRWKAERKFSYGELWHRRQTSLQATTLPNNAEIFETTTNTANNKQERVNKNNEVNFFEKLQPYSQLESKYFQVCYSKPKTAGNGNIERKKLTTSFKEQDEGGSKRRRGRILNPIRRDVQKTKNALRWQGQNLKKAVGQNQTEEKS